MWWRVKFIVVVWGCLAQLSAAQQVSGGVPLPRPGPSSQPNVGVPLSNLPSQQPGVPLTNSPTEPGVSLPILTNNAAGQPQDFGNPVIVPLDTGVPLPRPGSSAGGQQPVGVPLPPYETVGAVQDTSSFGGVGGIRPVRDPELDPDVQRVVGLATVRDHLQLKARADTAVKISEIVTAHKQVVSGQLVYLTLRVGETVCPIGTPSLNACAFDPSEDAHICEIVVWERPWLNSTKVIDEKSRCAETEDDNDFNVWGIINTLHPTGAEIPVQTLPQGISEQQLGLEAFNYVDRGSESKFRGELVSYDIGRILFDPVQNMTQVQVNVEYGFNLCLRSPDEKTDPRVCPRDNHRDHYICSVTVVHNPNQIASLDVVPVVEDDDDIKCERRRSVDEELVVPVRAPCLGCPQAAPLNDPTILEIADFALKEYDRASNEDELHMILRLVKAQTQVVAGVKYYLTIELAETHCKKQLTGVDVNRTFCPQDVTEETEICDLHVVDQPWVPSRDLVASQCYDKDDYPTSTQDEFIVPVALGTGLGAPPSVGTTFRTSPQTNSGQKPLEINPQTLEIARLVVAEYNRREDDDEYYKFVKLHEASSQNVGGTMYRVVVELAETNCHKLDPTLGNGEHCIINPSEDHEVCKAEVLVQPGVPAPGNQRLVSFTCDDLDDYLRETLMPTLSSVDLMDHPFLNLPQGNANIPGAQPLALNDSKVHEAAAFVVEQYNLRGDEDELYVLTDVVSANMQQAHGITYLLEVELAETHCKKYLPIADPSRCVLDHGEEREICQAEVMMPLAPGQAKQLTKLYCDERDDYYLNKIRGKIIQKSGVDPSTFRTGAPGGQWIDMDVNDKSLKKLGIKIADEFDFRSDEDNLFIFQKALKGRKQVTSGVRYHVMVELVETVCPKYKRRINKARCAPDIGEDHMICEAIVMVQPWLDRQDVMNLHCTEKEHYHDGDESFEVNLPNVHPTAHARPVFKSQFLVRDSIESEESNERFYDPSGRTTFGSDESFEDDSDELTQHGGAKRFYEPSGRTNIHRHDSDEDDSDELPSFRGKRMALGGPGGLSLVDVNDSGVQENAKFAISSVDSLSDDPFARNVEVLEAHKQVVAGLNWHLKLKVYWTTCKKGEQVDIDACEKDTERPSTICNAIVYEKPWVNFKKVSEMKCRPENEKQ
ncbi:uncharacterized protein LOC119581949 isoform X1 [Penaeus monodon]|uniref:uncharacterized protein LOC119581949 isoform X1 n=1 Tax=Penaeus monodon TaxID=6687 RepID=UPI0018A770ED|nr:uncharacterized protein LOC119581949 isoform X1 [Penaeus monodon]